MKDSIKNKFLKSQSYVNGKWIDASSGKTFGVYNPYNGEKITDLADLGAADAEKAIEQAQTALEKWKAKSATGRAKVLRKWYELQIQHLDDLAELLTIEQGKPIQEAKGEIKYGASFVEWFAEEAKRIYGDVLPGQGRNTRITVIKQAVGVVAAITPWNFPHAMITRKVAPALAAGCSVVLKPAEDTPLSALALAVLAEEAGIPPGVFNVITTSNAKEVGKVLTTHPVVKKISFTGSTEVGKILMKQAAGTVKKVSLELGGNAPFIVFDDADVDAAVKGAMAAKYRNTGQTCICANRIFVHAPVYEEFVEKFSAASAQLNVGQGLDEKVQIGPLINKSAVEKVAELVEDAENNGASIALGGKAGEGNFYEPTVLTDVQENMKIHHTEIFGPVAAIYKFESEEEVIRMANNTNYGLAAYFYGSHYARIWKVAEALEYGMVGINTGNISTVLAPFGGVKESGIGREGSKYGIEEFIEIKYMCWNLG